MLPLLLACTSSVPTVSETSDTGGAPPTAAERTWVGVTSYPCGIDSEGWVECWRSERWSRYGLGTGDGSGNQEFWPIGNSPEPLELVYAQVGSLAWGTRPSDGLPVEWACPGVLSGGCQAIPEREFSAIGHEVGLVEGKILGWANFTGEFDSEAEYVDLHCRWGAIQGGQTCAGLTQESRVDFARSPNFHLQFPPELEIQTFISFDVQHACVLSDQGEVRCPGVNPPVFDNGPYRMLDGGSRHVCAVREDWVVECSDGSEYDYGPIRAISAGSMTTYEWDPGSGAFADEGRWVGQPTERTDPPHLCVVTESNTIQCTGWRYDFADLQASLPGGGAGI